MATKIAFSEFSILLWSKSNDLRGNRIGIKNLPNYPHPLILVKYIIKLLLLALFTLLKRY